MSNPHLLRYSKAVIYLPTLTRARPQVTEHQKALAAESPPHPVPYHCKPWVDGQTAGWTLRYGFFTPLTIVGLGDGKVRVDNLDALFEEAKVLNHVEQFAPGFLSFSTGYTLRTAPGMVTMMLPPTQPIEHYDSLIGIVETDWFPKEVFVVIKAPPKGVSMTLEYETELTRLIVVPRQTDTQIEEISAEEVTEIRRAEQEYRQDEETTTSRWDAANGTSFTHVYKQRSKAYLRTLKQNNSEASES